MALTLTIDQQKELYLGLYDHIVNLHVDINTHGDIFKNDLISFTKEFRHRKYKGIVLLDYTNITDMIGAVKNKKFNYQWVKRDEAMTINHRGVTQALTTMNPTSDCVLVCSLSLSLKHLYINCVKIRNLI